MILVAIGAKDTLVELLKVDEIFFYYKCVSLQFYLKKIKCPLFFKDFLAVVGFIE